MTNDAPTTMADDPVQMATGYYTSFTSMESGILVQIPYDVANDNPDSEWIMNSAFSTIDNGYIGNVEHAEDLEARGIRPQLVQPFDPDQPGRTCQIGFCEAENKWYGWSHRAMFGFTIGSEVKKGDCAYNANTDEEFIEEALAWCSDDTKTDLRASKILIDDEYEGVDGQTSCEYVRVYWTYMDNFPNEKMHWVEGSSKYYRHPRTNPPRGEWVAKTMEDAKQMAIDFAEGVS